MREAYYQISSSSPSSSFSDCHDNCQKEKNVDLVFYTKKTHTCDCLKQVDKKKNADIIYGDVNPNYTINPVAFWITFTIFIIFIILLIYFFIQVFFIRVKKK